MRIMKNTITKVIINFSLVLLSIIVALVLMEVILRFTDYKKFRVHYGYPQYHFKASDDLGYDISENFRGRHKMLEAQYDVFSNKYGCFDFNEEVDREYGIISGDSFTWGYSPIEKKWTTVLENLSSMQMLKCGVTGYGTKQEFIKIKKTVEKIGHNPKYIMILYVGNDLNDDFAFPQRTVIEGNLLGTVRKIDLVNGVQDRYSEDELISNSKKYLDNTIAGYFRRFRYNTVLYNLYRGKIKRVIREILAKPAAVQESTIKKSVATEKSVATKAVAKKSVVIKTDAVKKMAMPTYMNGFYGVSFSDYFDSYDIKWYNDAIKDHKKTIIELNNYAKSVGAKLLFVDLGGFLTHKRFNDIRSLKNLYYYNLKKDYPNQKTWKYDGHWNIEGNREAGEFIYKHYKSLGFFK